MRWLGHRLLIIIRWLLHTVLIYLLCSICKLNCLIGYISSDTIAFASHYILNIYFIVFEPTKIIGNKMQRVAILASNKNDTLLVAVPGKSSCLLMITLATCISHQKEAVLPTGIPFDLVAVNVYPPNYFVSCSFSSFESVLAAA